MPRSPLNTEPPTPNPPSIQVVVFDAVGTLIYAEPDVAQVYTTVAHRFGSKLDKVEIERRFRQAFKDEEADACNGAARTSEAIECDRWRRIVQQVVCDLEDTGGCFSELFAHFARADSWRVFADAPHALADLRSSGFRVGVASNFDCRLFEILRSIESMRHFDFVLACSQIGYRKPHQGFFDAIVAHAAVPPASILYVGDDPQNDLAGAQAIGMHALLVNRARPRVSEAILSLRELVFSVL